MKAVQKDGAIVSVAELPRWVVRQLDARTIVQVLLKRDAIRVNRTTEIDKNGERRTVENRNARWRGEQSWPFNSPESTARTTGPSPGAMGSGLAVTSRR